MSTAAPEAAQPAKRTEADGAASGARVRSAALWVVVALLALTPLLTGNLTGLGIGPLPLFYDNIALPRVVVTLVGVMAALALALAAAWLDGRELRFDVPLAVLVGLAGWAALSDALSPHWALGVLGQSERLEGVVAFLCYALLYAAGLQVVGSARDVRRMAAALVAAATLSALYGVSQFLGFDPTSYAVEAYGFDLHRAFATFGNPDFLAGLLVLALPCAIALAWVAPDRLRRVAWSAASLLIGTALLLTFARSGWLAVVVEGVLALIVWRSRGLRWTRNAWIAVGVAAVVLVVLAVSTLSNTAETNVLSRLGDFASSGGSASERALVLQTAALATAARPVFGYGPDAFLAAFRANRPDAYAARFGATATIANAHSWPAQLAATVGLPGALLLVVALGLAAWRGRKHAFVAEGERFDPVMAATYLGCIGFMAFMLASVAVPGSTTPFWLLLGALGAPAARRVRTNRLVKLAGASIFGVLTAAALAAGWALLSADHGYLKARVAFRQGDVATATQRAARATRLNPLSIKYARGAAQIADQGVASKASGAQPAQISADLARASAAYDRALALDSADYPSLAFKAALLARIGDDTGDSSLKREAVALAQRAAALDRQHAEVARLAAGDTSPSAVAAASAVPPLP